MIYNFIYYRGGDTTTTNIIESYNKTFNTIHNTTNAVDVFSQSYENMDITLRRLAQNFYAVRRSSVPFCIVARRIRRRSAWMNRLSR